MPITDLASWANNLETVRLPLIESNHTALVNLVQQNYQTFLNTRDQHSAQITSAQADADQAQADAAYGLTQIYETGLDAKTYTDHQIQLLRNELLGQVTSLSNYVNTDLPAQLDTQISAEIAQSQANITAAINTVESVRDQMVQENLALQSAADEIMNTLLPEQATTLDSITNGLGIVKQDVDLVLAGFNYNTLVEGLDDVRARVAATLPPIGFVHLRQPFGDWTIDGETSVYSPKSPANTYWFNTGDATFGDFVRLPLEQTVTIGQIKPIDFVPGRVYRVTTRVRANAAGSLDGVKMALGVSTFRNGVAVQTAIKKDLASPFLLPAAGVKEYVCYFSTDLTKLQAPELTVGTTAASQAIHLSESSTATKAFFFIEQNTDGLSNGQLDVALLEVKDVTEALEAAQLVRTQMESRFQTANASIATLQTTVSDLDTAFAGYQTEVEADFNAVNANLTTNYYTRAQADNAMSTRIDTFEAEFRDPVSGQIKASALTNYYTSASTDTAISNASTALQSLIRATVLPSDFRRDGFFWSHTLSGEPSTKADLGSPASFETDSVMGRIVRHTAPITGNRHIAPKEYVENKEGKRWRITVKARHNNAFAGNSQQALRWNFWKINSSFGNVSSMVSGSWTFSSTGSVETFTAEATADGATPYLVPFIFVEGSRFGTAGPQIDVQSVLIEDITETSAINATLASNYYTRAQADSAIAAADTALSASVLGQVNTNLSTNYMTSAQTNTAITQAKTEMQGEISSVSGQVPGFQMILDEVSDVVVGAAVGVSLGGAALGQTNTLLITENSTARSSYGTGNGARITVPVEKALQFGGQRVKISVLAKKPGSNAANTFAVCYGTNENGASSFMESSALSTTWAWYSFFYNVPAPTAGNSDVLNIFGDSSKTGKATQVARVIIQLTALAEELPEISSLSGEITDIKALKLSALTGTAFGTLLTQLNVNAAGTSATVTSMGSAIASLQNNATASYLFRVQAGSANSLLELVAADNPTSGPKAVARIKADDILLEGSVGVNSLSVTDFSGNLVPGGSFPYGDLRDWKNVASTLTVIAKDSASSVTAINTAPTSYVLRLAENASANAEATATVVPVTPGQRYIPSFWYAGSSTSTAEIGMYFRYYDASGAFITGNNKRTVVLSGTTAWTEFVGSALVVPANAATMRVNVIRYAGGGGSAYMTNIDVRRQMSAGILITPQSITGAELIKTENLITQSAQIGNAVVNTAHISSLEVDTLWIKDEAVTSLSYGYTGGTVLVDSETTEVSIASVTINRTAGYSTRIGFSCQINNPRTSGNQTRIAFRLYRGATLIQTWLMFADSNSESVGEGKAFIVADTNTGGGSTTYVVKAVMTSAGRSGNISKRSLEAQQIKR